MWDRNRRNMLGTVDDMPQYRKYMTQALTDAPHFMITWTPNHVSSSSQPMLDGMQQYFNGSIDMGTFIDEMKALPTE